jgi:hypothetical protein
MRENLMTAVIRSGLIPEDLIVQMNRWGVPLQVVEEKDIIRDPKEVALLIEEALTERDMVELRTTDLDVLREFLEHQKIGRLIIYDPETDQKGSFEVSYYLRTSADPKGEVVFPWKSESITHLLVNDRSYLRTTEGTKYRFSEVRELFFGEHKAFVACKVSKEETRDGSGS